MNQKIKFTLIGISLSVLFFVVLSSSSSTKFSYGKGRYNLVDKYFQEIVNESPELKILESELRNLENKQEKLEDDFKNYHSKSKEYYKDATDVMNEISDSALKRKMLSIITKSTENYNSKSLVINNNLKTITKNDVVLSDYHRVLKLVKTLAFMEKYQNEAKPQVKLYEDFISEQTNMVEKIKSQTPKY